MHTLISWWDGIILTLGVGGPRMLQEQGRQGSERHSRDLREAAKSLFSDHGFLDRSGSETEVVQEELRIGPGKALCPTGQDTEVLSLFRW